MVNTSVLIRIFFVFIGISQTLPLNAQDISSMNAVQLNTKGFNLYNEKKYEESLVYFKASFENNPEYGFPHYNYACVLSILKMGKEEIREHLLKSFFLNPTFRKKYFTDPDLEWFRRIPAQEMPQSDYFDFNEYKMDTGAETVKKHMLHGKKLLDYDVDLADQYWAAFLTFNSAGTVRIWSGESDVTGKYRIQGNLVYIELNEDFICNDAFAFARVILQCIAVSDQAAKLAGFALSPDSSRPIRINIHIDGGV